MSNRPKARASTPLRVFTAWDDRLFVRCIPPYLWATQRHPEAPHLTALQREALKAVEAMAEEPDNHLLMELRPGHIRFIDFHVLHSRTVYVDDRPTDRVRQR